MWSRPRARTAAAPPSRRWERGWAGSESTATCTWTRRRSPYAPIGRPRCALRARRHALPGPETILTSVRVSGQPSRSPRRASGLQNDIHQTLASATGANDLSQPSARPAAPAHAPPHTRRFSCPLVWAPFRLSSGSRLTVHRILRRPDGADALPRALVPCVLTGLLQAELSLRLALHLAARIPQPLEGRLAGSDGHVVAAILAFHLRLRITVTHPQHPALIHILKRTKLLLVVCVHVRCLSLTEVLRAAVQVGLPSACGFAIARHRAVLVTVLGLGVCCALPPLHWIPRQKRCDPPTPPPSPT